MAGSRCAAECARLVARFDLKLVSAERNEHRLLIGLDVHRDGEPFQYFECWTSRVGDVPFGDRQQLVAAAIHAVSDRLAGRIQPLGDPRDPIIVPIESHPHGLTIGADLADAVLNLIMINDGSLEPPTVHSIELADAP